MVAEEPNDAFDRIDFVCYSANDGVTVLEAYELDGRNSANPWPSDHRAVLSAFRLTPPIPEAKTTLPSPADGATNVTVNPTLTWLPGMEALSHDLYFGTTPTISAHRGSPRPATVTWPRSRGPGRTAAVTTRSSAARRDHPGPGMTSARPRQP